MPRMPRTLLCVLLIAIAGTCWAADSLPTKTKAFHAGMLNMLPMLGPVKTWRSETVVTDYESGKLTTNKPNQTTLIEYDRAGNLVRCDTPGDFGPFPSSTKSEYTFDPSRRVIEMRVLTCKDPKAPSSVYTAWERYTYKYDDKGNQIEQCTYTGDVLTSKWISAYDSKGNKTESDFYQPPDKLYRSLATTYDSQGRPVEEVRTFSGGSAERAKLTYGPDGKHVSMTTYLKDGSVKGREEKVTEGKLTRRTYYSADGIVANIVVKDSEDRLISQENLNPDGSRWRFESRTYKYDSYGNGIETTGCRLDYKNGKVESKHCTESHRTIQYYN